MGEHYQGPVQDILQMQWDMLISFPPCTHLAVSGARHFREKIKDGRQAEAAEFFILLAEAGHIKKGLRKIQLG